MTIGLREREENQQLAFSLMMNALGDQAIDTTLFDSGVRRSSNSSYVRRGRNWRAASTSARYAVLSIV